MRQSSLLARRLGAATTATVAALAIGVSTGFGSTPPADGSVAPQAVAPISRVIPPTSAAPSTTPPTPLTPTTPTTLTTPMTPVAVVTSAPGFATGNGQLDTLLATLPPVLFEAEASVHFGYNPVDCCHAGGYNPEPNEVWVSERALSSVARLTYVTTHELAHSLHLRSARGAALTAAVAGAPVVRAGSPWDASEKVADCVAWVLYPVETAASGLTYWSCPDPWRSQVRAALA